MSDNGTTHGVVFVHGIGSQHQSDILLDIGGPLFAWLAVWHAARRDSPSGALPEPAPRIDRSALNFSPTEESPPSKRSHATITLGNGDRWIMTEAWWASEYRRQQLGPMALWAWQHLWDTAVSLFRSFRRRLTDHEKDGASVDRRLRKLLAAYTLVMVILYFCGALIGLPIVGVLLLLAQIPIPQVRALFIVALQPFLEVNIGEFRTICEDELQAANMRRVVAEMVLDLVADGCRDVTIVAHSGGAVVASDMLADPVYTEAASHVRKFITAGSGMNKAWTIARGRELARLLRPIRCNVHWVDLWGTLDPVPQGWMIPPILAGHAAAVAVFTPSDQVIAAQGLRPRTTADPFDEANTAGHDDAATRYWPTSVKVTNALSVLADHGEYWQNEEEVIARIVAEIDAEYYRDSRYWRGYLPVDPADKAKGGYLASVERAVRRTIRQRRERVIVLAMWRALMIALWLIAVPFFWDGVAMWLRTHRGWFPIPTWLAALADSSVGGYLRLVAIASHFAAAILIGVPFLFVFLIVQSRWRHRNDAAMQAATRAVACARPAV